jgi:hypothetical protein
MRERREGRGERRKERGRENRREKRGERREERCFANFEYGECDIHVEANDGDSLALFGGHVIITRSGKAA